MTNLYVTTTELKTFLGISGSTHDTVLAMLNKFAAETLNGILSVTDLSAHIIAAEVHNGGADRYELRDLNIIAIGTIMEDTTEYTQTDAYDFDNYLLYLEDALTSGEREVTIEYAAGWFAAGNGTLVVDDYSLITGSMTITIAPGGSGSVVLTEGTNWDAETDNDTTASNIAAAINANATLAGASGVRAFAIGATVYLVDKEAQRETSTVVLSASTGLTLSGSPLTTPNFPESLRYANMLLVAGMFARRKNASVKSYTSGSKSVSFASKEDKEDFVQAVAPYMRAKIHVL